MKLPKGENPFVTKSSEVLYERPYLRFVKDVAEMDGKEFDRSYADIADGIGILAVNEKSEVALVGQFRYAIGKYTWEVPAGMRDGDEEPLDTAKRELQEEAGLKAQDWVDLGSFYMESSSTTKVSHAFLARDLEQTKTAPEDDERIDMLWITYDEALQKIKTGEIDDGLSVLALLRAQEYLRKKE
ncbi:NUDIX hydrolase [Patescibacteria group bacterium]|nr:NUDIX hydrolase [Patescibacteria group bacterium]